MKKQVLFIQGGGGRKDHEADAKLVLVGHSLGASMLLKYLSENKTSKKIEGVFLVATPFWSGEEGWVEGLKLRTDFPDKLPKDVPIFLYHSIDDKIIPVEHLLQYRERLREATVREIPTGGHQMNDDLTLVANDIKTL